MHRFCRLTPEGLLLRVKVVANSSKTELKDCPEGQDRIKLRVAAPALDGKANEEIREFLKKIFKIPKKQIEFLRGELAREKDILLRGVSFEDAQKLFKS